MSVIKKTLSLFIPFFMLSSAQAEVITCKETYAGKPFRQVTIWSNMSGFGPADCGYMAEGDKELVTYEFPKEEDYYRVSGRWRSTMPGFQWCRTEDGNTAATCRFAKKEK